jgi:hypothetical protein
MLRVASSPRSAAEVEAFAVWRTRANPGQNNATWANVGVPAAYVGALHDLPPGADERTITSIASRIG